MVETLIALTFLMAIWFCNLHFKLKHINKSLKEQCKSLINKASNGEPEEAWLAFLTNKQLIEELVKRKTFEGVIVIKLNSKFENCLKHRDKGNRYTVVWTSEWGFYEVRQASEALQDILSTCAEEDF